MVRLGSALRWTNSAPYFPCVGPALFAGDLIGISHSSVCLVASRSAPCGQPVGDLTVATSHSRRSGDSQTVAVVVHLTEQQCGDHPVQQHQPGLVAALAVLTPQAEQLGVKPGLGNDWCLVAQPHAPVAPCPANGLSPMLSPGCSGLCRAVRVASGARRFTLWW